MGREKKRGEVGGGRDDKKKETHKREKERVERMARKQSKKGESFLFLLSLYIGRGRKRKPARKTHNSKRDK